MSAVQSTQELSELDLFSEEFLCDGLLDDDVFLRCASPTGVAKQTGRCTPASSLPRHTL